MGAFLLPEIYFFDIVIPMNGYCDMCLVVIDHTVAKVNNTKYCSFCYQDGRLVYAEDDIHTFRKRYFDKLHAEGANEFVARFHTLLIGSAPYWKVRRG